MLSKQKKAQNAKGNRVLITINVPGSAGPLRFVVYEEELVTTVIDMALKSYARAGRLPVLGSDVNDFLLYCPAGGSDAMMNPCKSIRAYGGRNFVLCKKSQAVKDATPGTSPGREDESPPRLMAKKGSGRWKSWINKSLSFKIASH